MSASGPSGLLDALKRPIKEALHRAVRVAVPIIKPTVLDCLPHDPEAYVQGLAYAGGALYESTGLHGQSSLRRLDPRSGGILERVDISDDFAEGIAVCNDRIYQLTLSSGRVFVYDVATLRRVCELPLSGEGWGLASDGTHLIVSDGTSVLQFRDLEFALLRRLRVTSHGLPVRRLNDIEWSRGLIFANLWYSGEIAVASAATGRLSHIVDCSGLIARERPRNPHCILNGIAYDPDDDRLFLTGKNWRHLFVVRLPEPVGGLSRNA